jgi:hypothetical protein
MEAPLRDAQRLTRLEQAVQRALELLAAQRADDARSELERAVASAQADSRDEVTDLELDRAFDRAEPVADEVVDADRVAREAILAIDRELVEERSETPTAFATSTMAELLERQGDLDGARRIREALARREPRRETAPRLRPRPDRARVLATLEQWLANVREREGA